MAKRRQLRTSWLVRPCTGGIVPTHWAGVQNITMAVVPYNEQINIFNRVIFHFGTPVWFYSGAIFSTIPLWMHHLKLKGALFLVATAVPQLKQKGSLGDLGQCRSYTVGPSPWLTDNGLQCLQRLSGGSPGWWRLSRVTMPGWLENSGIPTSGTAW